MSDDTATVEIAPELKQLGDQIANLTLKQAKELSDYLKSEYDIEPAAGGGIVGFPWRRANCSMTGIRVSPTGEPSSRPGGNGR